jgi:hypothetical protein
LAVATLESCLNAAHVLFQKVQLSGVASTHPTFLPPPCYSLLQIDDGCDGVATCPTCSAASRCTPDGRCVSVCVPKTTCSAGLVCGTEANGCGGESLGR